MSCSQTLSGIAASCDTSIGGILEAYIANHSDVTAVTPDAEGGEIGTITMDTGKKFKKYSFKKNSGSMVSTLTVDPVNGVNFVTTDLVLSFAKQETAKRIEMSALSLGELAVIVKDANGKYFYLGLNEPVTASAGSAETGQNRTDGNRYSITLQDISETFPFLVPASVVAGVIE